MDAALLGSDGSPPADTSDDCDSDHSNGADGERTSAASVSSGVPTLGSVSVDCAVSSPSFSETPTIVSADFRNSEECPDSVGTVQTGRGAAIEGTLLPQLNMDALVHLSRNNKKAEAHHILHCLNGWSTADKQADLGIVVEDTCMIQVEVDTWSKGWPSSLIASSLHCLGRRESGGSCALMKRISSKP